MRTSVSVLTFAVNSGGQDASLQLVTLPVCLTRTQEWKMLSCHPVTSHLRHLLVSINNHNCVTSFTVSLERSRDEHTFLFPSKNMLKTFEEFFFFQQQQTLENYPVLADFPVSCLVFFFIFYFLFSFCYLYNNYGLTPNGKFHCLNIKKSHICSACFKITHFNFKSPPLLF